MNKNKRRKWKEENKTKPISISDRKKIITVLNTFIFRVKRKHIDILLLFFFSFIRNSISNSRVFSVWISV